MTTNGKSTSARSKPIEWTEDHDILLMREMMLSDLFLYKNGSPNRGLVWDAIVENLNKIETPVFALKDKRSVRDRWTKELVYLKGRKCCL